MTDEKSTERPMVGSGTTVTEDVGRSTAEIARLFEVASREDEAIYRLDGCMTELREVQAARRALTAFTPAELQAALAYRRRALDGRAS
ncbi:hypothetical protein [Friedmanniella luteola]|uniref:hypothetical protein n=1 Tax=Friedmanniella luteola TaxID=546871 RepID=UPI0012FD12A7|nr:hypothetical protein [Friedmanniella luteola]